jgi:hypothetical protein
MWNKSSKQRRSSTRREAHVRPLEQARKEREAAARGELIRETRKQAKTGRFGSGVAGVDFQEIKRRAQAAKEEVAKTGKPVIVATQKRKSTLEKT